MNEHAPSESTHSSSAIDDGIRGVNHASSSLQRVLIASSSPPDKGSGIRAYVNELCESLVGLGIDLHYYSPPPSDPSWLESLGITHLAADQHSDPIVATRELLSYMRAHAIDGAINNDNALLQSAAPLLNCPLLVIGHMDRRSVGTLACFQPEWSDHVVAISSDMQRTFTRRYGVPITKTPVVYNGVQDRGVSAAPAPDRKRPLRVAYAGGYSHNKGGSLIVKSLIDEPQSWKNIDFHWFGDVPERIQNKLAGKSFIRFAGRTPREEFHEMLAKADVFLLPSRKEGCPMALLEALSFGAVPIASNGVGAMRWIVQPGRNGFICDLDRFPSQLGRCLEYLESNREALNKLRLASRESFLRDFQSEQTARELLDLLSRPTVDRSNPPKTIPILRWHRPFRPDGLKSPLIDRFCIRFGILRRAGFWVAD